MYNVLCFGDSNTWGFMPGLGTRYPRDIRWPGIVQKNLGDDFYIIEEGMNGRTCGHSDIISPQRSGIDYIYPCLVSQKPLDLIIVFLGTNDTKARYHMNAYEVSLGMKNLLHFIRSHMQWEGIQADILLVAPAPLEDYSVVPNGQVDEFSVATSRKLAPFYKAIAEEMGLYFMDAADYATELGVDGIHFTPASHAKMAEAMTAKILEIKQTQGR